MGGRNIGNVCGGNLKKIRKMRGYTQQKLANEAQLLGLSVNKKVISLIESGERYFLDKELIIFAKILRVPTYYLTDGVPPKLP